MVLKSVQTYEISLFVPFFIMRDFVLFYFYDKVILVYFK